MTTPLLNEIDILRDVTGRLDQVGTAYMVTGSMAMNYYAQPRMTRDIDVVVEIFPAEVDKIEAIFSSDYIIDHDALSYAAEHEFMFNIIHCKSVVKVDFIVRKSTEYRHLEFSRRIKVKISDFYTWLVSKEDLVLRNSIGRANRILSCNWVTCAICLPRNAISTIFMTGLKSSASLIC